MSAFRGHSDTLNGCWGALQAAILSVMKVTAKRKRRFLRKKDRTIFTRKLCTWKLCYQEKKRRKTRRFHSRARFLLCGCLKPRGRGKINSKKSPVKFSHAYISAFSVAVGVLARVIKAREA